MGGRMRQSSVSVLAMAACVGFMMQSGSAKAADLGGGCCADLEERVAELEATTARKGNRTVSLTISGQVTKQLLIWDDGVNSDVYVEDNAINTSRFAFDGKAKVAPGVTAGYLLQLDVGDSLSSIVNNRSKSGDEGQGDVLSLRTNVVYLESERLGKLSIGQNYSLNDALYVPLQIGNTYNTAGGPYADGFSLMTGAGADSGLTWGKLMGMGPRRNDYVRYDSPSIKGFMLTALAGDNDIWEVGGRYAGKVDRFQISTAVDYYNYNAEPLGPAGGLAKFQEWAGLFSIKDAPTGLFLTVWGAQRHYERDGATGAPAGSHFADTGHMVQGIVGVEKKFMPYGNTTIYVDYGRYENMAGTGLSASSLKLGVGGADAGDYVANSTIDRVGFGVVQTIDSAGLDLFGIVEHYEADVTVGDVGSNATSKANLKDWTGAVIGSRIKF